MVLIRVTIKKKEKTIKKEKKWRKQLQRQYTCNYQMN